MASRTLTVKVVGNDAGASRAIGKVGESAHKTGGMLGELKHHAVALVGAFVGFEAITKGAEFLKEATKAAADDQAQLAILANQSNRAGVSWKTHGEEIEKTITKMSTASGFIKSELINSYGRLVTATHSAGKSTKLLGDAENIARARHIDLQAASQILIKANMGNAGALKKLGIATVEVTKHQDSLKRKHDELILAGHKFTAAENIAYKAQLLAAKAADKHATALANLRMIHKMYAGAADAYGKTAAGQLAKLGASWDQVKVKVGNVILPILGRFAAFLTTQLPAAFATASAFVSRNAATFKLIGEAVGVAGAAVLAYLVITKTVAVAEAIYRGLSTAIFLVRNAQIALNVAMEMNPIGLIIGALTLLGVGLYVAYQRSTTFRNIVNAAFNAVKAAAQAALGWITGTGMPAVISAWNRAKPVISALAAIVRVEFALIKGYIQTVVAVVSALLHGNFSQAFDIAKAAVAKLASKVSEVMGKIPGILQTAIGAIGSAALAIGMSIVNGILSGAGGLYGRLKSKLESDIKGALKSLSPFSPVEHGGRIHIGEPLVAGALKGVAELGPKLRRALSQQVRDAVTQAKQNLSSLGGSLSGTLNSLLDAKLGGSAASKNLRDAQARQSEMDFQKQKTDLQTTIGGTGTDEEKAKAQAGLDVLLSQRAFDLEQAKTDDQKQQNTRRLADLAASLNRGLITQKEYQKQVKALMAGQGADYQSAGDQLGLAFADGFMAQLKDMLAQAAAVTKSRLPGLSELSGNVTDPLATVRGELTTARNDRKQLQHDARQKSSAGGVKVTHVEQVGIDAARAQERILQRILDAMTTGAGAGITFNQTPANADPHAIAAAVGWARRTVSTA